MKTQPKIPEIKKEFTGEIEQKYRSGALQATIFSNEIESEKYGKHKVFSFNIQRSYKDKQEQWQKTHSFRKQDVANIQALMHRITDFLYINEDEEQETTQ